MPESTAVEAEVDASTTLSKSPVGPDDVAPIGDSTGILESPAAKARPKRVRKPRAKAETARIESARPILHLKGSTSRPKASEASAQTPQSEPSATEVATFELTGASEPPLPVERSAAPQQIEIPELSPGSRPNVEDGHYELPNGATHEAVATSPSIAEPLEQPSHIDRPIHPEPADDTNSSLVDDPLQTQPQIESDAPQAQGEAVAATDEVIEHPQQVTAASESPSAVQDHWRSPVPDDDPRFTYVPRYDRQPFPDEENLASPPPHPTPPDAEYPDSVEARESEPPVSPTEGIAHAAKGFKLDLRAQLVLLAVAPILVGSAIAFLVALLSPTLFAARSEVVVNVTSMDWSSAERFLATQLVVVKARSTLEPISQANGIPLQDLEKELKAELIGSSDVIRIQYANSDASLALDVVKAVTAQYLIDLRDYEQIGNGRHRVLMPATLLEEPVSLTPFYAGVIGAVVGFAIGVLGIVLRTQVWRMK